MFKASKLLRLKKWWLQHQWLSTLLVFSISVLMFSLWIPNDTFRDPDAFYHIGVTEQIIEQGWILTEFPWLHFTTIRDSYVDHHMLYHVLLVPFFLLFGPYAGIKIATILLGAGVITTTHHILQKFGLRYTALFSLLLLFTYQSSFRYALSKAPSMSIILLFIAFALLAHKRYIWLALLSFIYVWSYGGFPLLFVLTGFALIISLGQYYFTNKNEHNTAAIKSNIYSIIATSSGVLGALLLHPSFPTHFYFYWQQIIQIGLVNYQDIIGVGGEWYPLPLDALVFNSPHISALLLLSTILVIKYAKKITAKSWLAYILSIFFCIFTLKSQRYLEYYIPWTVFASALIIIDTELIEAVHKIIRLWKKEATPAMHAASALLIVSSIVLLASIGWKTHTTLITALHKDAIEFERYAGPAEWLNTNAEAESIVLHSNWSDSLMLFHHAPSMRYIVGLDPTFMYNYDADLYWTWVNITTGEKSENLHATITEEFTASYVLIENDHTAMMKNIKAADGFTQVFEDEDAALFSVDKQ